jgi:hypothetical protein
MVAMAVVAAAVAAHAVEGAVQWHRGVQLHDRHGVGGGADLANRGGGVTADQCADWCCAVDACVVFFHTKKQLGAAGNCSAGAPCCWLKPTWNSSRAGDACAVPSDCVSGVRWAITANPMFTRFAADVSPTMPTAYPRPQLSRGADSWQSLNGLWSLDVQHGVHSLPSEPPSDSRRERQQPQQVLVPYPLEAALSGVRANPSDWVGGEWGQRKNGSSPCVFVYNRSFAISPALEAGGGRRVVLRFEAVMASAAVFLNGVLLGTHRGGYDDFSFDVTEHLRPVASGVGNMLELACLNDAWFHGKQFNKHFLQPGGISYSPSSGIWQTVWLERLPAAVSIVSAVGSTKADLSGFDVNVTIERSRAAATTGLHASVGSNGGRLRVQLTLDDGATATATATASITSSCSVAEGTDHCVVVVALPPAQRRPWTPATHYLYNFSLALLKDNGNLGTTAAAAATTLDTVHSYAALRTIGMLTAFEPPISATTNAGGDGPDTSDDISSSGKGGGVITRLALNGKRTYLIGTLDQGFWPESAYTAPTDEALASDLVTLKALGFDALRKHQKVEPRRFYYHCDRLGASFRS